jgi:hypothetical protein
VALVPALFVYSVVNAQMMGEGDFGFMQFGGGAVGGVTTFPDGAVGAPSVAFTSAPTTGMWYTGGQIHFSTAGADRGYFSSVGVVTTNAFSLNALSYIQSPSSGVIKLTDTNDSDFSRLQLGGTTASVPAIKKSSTTVAFRLADDSNDAPITASNATLSGTMTSSLTTTLGWSVVSGANQLGTTTCTSACVFCADTSAGTVLKSCSDATADICVCAGAS